MRVWVMVGVVSALVAFAAPAAAAERALFEGSMSIEGRRPAPAMEVAPVVDCAKSCPASPRRTMATSRS